MNNHQQIIIWALVCICIIVLYQFIHIKLDNTLTYDPMLITYGNTFIDGWLISHFVVFMAAGYFYPNTFALAMMIGIGWEVLECVFGYIIYYLEYNTYQLHNWWFGQYKDVIANYMGFLFGQFLFTM